MLRIALRVRLRASPTLRMTVPSFSRRGVVQLCIYLIPNKKERSHALRLLKKYDIKFVISEMNKTDKNIAFLREEGGPRSGGRSLAEREIWIISMCTRSPSVASRQLPPGGSLFIFVQIDSSIFTYEVCQ